jgi:hypothetical protein
MRRAIALSLFIPLVLWLASPRPAEASVDLTGAYAVVAQTIVGPYEVAFDFVQTGTQLDLTYRFPNNPPSGPYTGTIDPDTGAFTIPLPNSGSPIPCSGNQIAGTASADGQSISGNWTAYFDNIHLFCQDGGGPFTGQRNVCGDGIVAGSEACDDASCCSADCSTLTPDATPCDDGNACTNGEQCSAGSCGGGTPLYCQPCESCSPGGCVVADDAGCGPALGGGKSTILMRRKSGAPEKDALTWKWKNGAPMSIADFGDPPTSTGSYYLCVIDHTGGVPTLRMQRTAPGGAFFCSDGNCWKPRPNGFAYTAKSGQPEGITAMTLGAGDTGHGKINVKGKGAALALPAGLFTAPVTVRLKRDDAPACWDATFSVPKKNDGTLFKAKSD